MAKKQTRRSISVSRTTYERLKAFCESNNISMSQLVETRVNDFLGPSEVAAGVAPGAAMASSLMGSPVSPRPMMSSALPPRPLEVNRTVSHPAPGVGAPSAPSAARLGLAAPAAPAAVSPAPAAPQASQPPPSSHGGGVPMTSAAARFAIEPPPPIIKPRQETAAPKPAEKRPEQIFTF